MTRICTLIVVIFCASLAYSQETAKRVPTLDQFELRNAKVMEVRSGVWVDRNTFDLMQPLIRNARAIEDDYVAVFVLDQRDVDHGQYHDAFKRKTLAIYRSIELIKKEISSDSAIALLNENQQLIKDMHATLLYMSGGSAAPYQGELVTICERYSIPEAKPWYNGTRLAGRTEMLTAMLSRLNKNFSKFYSSEF
jgi:hypothetical protein